MLGSIWSLITPLIMLVVYAWVFGGIFHSKWGNSLADAEQFPALLFTGMIAFNFFSECVVRAPQLVLENRNYVKKVVFPLEILPWILLFSAGFNALLSLLILFVYEGLRTGILPATTLLIPVVMTQLMLLVIGLSYLLAALGVFFRDIAQTVSLLVSVVMFLSPVFYPVSALPERYRYLMELNPLTSVIEESRDILIRGHGLTMSAVMLSTLLNLGLALFGYGVFMKTKKWFSDVI